MRYATKRNYILNPNLAYSVGLMASDGCLQKDGRHIDLTSIDIEQLENFATALGRTFTIGRKKNGSGKFALRIQFSDVAYYDFLVEIGLTPAKSKTIGLLSIPDPYYADFLRGYFDGDGSCYGYMDKRWRSSFMYYMQFTSASLRFLYYLQTSNSRLIGVGTGSIRKAKGAFTLSYAKSDSRKLYSHMYHSEDVLCLKRKQTKIMDFIQRDTTAIIVKF